MHELHVSKRKFSRSTEKARDNLRLEISSALALRPVRTSQIYVYFAKKSVLISVIQVRTVIFFLHQILSSLTKLQRRHRLALGEHNFLSDVKTERFYNLHAKTKEKLTNLICSNLNFYLQQLFNLQRVPCGPSYMTGPLGNSGFCFPRI